MKRTILFVAGLLVACSGAEPTGKVQGPGLETPATAAASAPRFDGKAPVAPVPLEAYFDIRRVGGASFSHDGKRLAFINDAGGRPDVWVKTIHDDGPPQKVTSVDGMVHSFAFSPASDMLLFEADKGGNELPHLYLIEKTGAAPRDLVADYPATARTQFVRWAEDGKTFLFLSNARDQKYMDLVEWDVAAGKATTLWESEGQIAFAITSRDHKRFVVIETISDVDNDLYLVERGKKERVLLTQHTGEVLHDPSSFSPDAQKVFLTSDAGGEFQRLDAIDLKTKKSSVVLEPKWDVESGWYTRSGRYFVTNVNADGVPLVTITDTKTKKDLVLPKTETGALIPVSFSRDERQLAVQLVSDAAPAKILVLDIEKGTTRPIVDALPPALAKVEMVAGRSVRIPSFDGKEVPAFVYAPKGPGPFPALIDVHGGPTSQSRVRFDPLRQYLVSKGYVVLVPNVRGSTGYGKTWTKLDNKDLGGGPLKDVVASKKWLVQNAKVDADRVVVFGASYGGYMALAAATFTPDEFAANVDIFGVSDLKSVVESFPPYWAAFATYIYKKFGDPKNPADAAYQRERSPLYFADRITRPLLVIQGANDVRVKKDQSDRIVDALKKRDVPVHYLVFPDEGHGFSRNENQLAAYKATDRFLDRYLFRDGSRPVLDGEQR